MSATNYLEDALIDHIFRSSAYTAPTTLYVALFTTLIAGDSPGTEVSTSGTAYARQAYGPGATYWSDPASTGETGNLQELAFPVPAGNWGTIVACGVYDAVTGGNALFLGNLDQQRQILSGDPAPKFLVGDLVVSVD